MGLFQQSCRRHTHWSVVPCGCASDAGRAGPASCQSMCSAMRMQQRQCVKARRAHVSCSTSAVCRSPHNSDALVHSPAASRVITAEGGLLITAVAKCQVQAICSCDHGHAYMSGKSTCLVELYRALHKSLTCPIMNRMAQLHEVTIHTRRYNWLIMLTQPTLIG